MYPLAFPGRAGHLGSIPGSGRSPGEGNGYPHQYSFLENSIDRGAWQATPWGHQESDTTEQLTLSLSPFGSTMDSFEVQGFLDLTGFIRPDSGESWETVASTAAHCCVFGFLLSIPYFPFLYHLGGKIVPLSLLEFLAGTQN